MGCDIHLFAEKKVNGKWLKIEGDFMSERNYNLFAILADVRNGRGFAGCDTGDGFAPLSEPKGLPNDVSDEIKKESDALGSDGHSHSYFTLLELAKIDWLQKTKLRGVIPFDEFTQLYEEGKSPKTWCGGISGRDIVTIGEKEAKVYAENPLQMPAHLKNKNLHVQYSWGVTYMEAVGGRKGNYFTSLSELMGIAGKGNDNKKDVRIVFWFDN